VLKSFPLASLKFERSLFRQLLSLPPPQLGRQSLDQKDGGCNNPSLAHFRILNQLFINSSLLHFLVYFYSPHIKCPSKYSGKRQYVFDLIWKIRTTCTNHFRPSRFRFFRVYFLYMVLLLQENMPDLNSSH
jgi:hypothetical protein